MIVICVTVKGEFDSHLLSFGVSNQKCYLFQIIAINETSSFLDKLKLSIAQMIKFEIL